MKMNRWLGVLLLLLLSIFGCSVDAQDSVDVLKQLNGGIAVIRVEKPDYEEGGFLAVAEKLKKAGIKTVVIAISFNSASSLSEIALDRLVGEFVTKGFTVFVGCQILNDNPKKESALVARSLDHSGVVGVFLFKARLVGNKERQNQWAAEFVTELQDLQDGYPTISPKAVVLAVPEILSDEEGLAYKRLTLGSHAVAPLVTVTATQNDAGLATYSGMIKKWQVILGTWGKVAPIIPFALINDSVEANSEKDSAPELTDQQTLCEFWHSNGQPLFGILQSDVLNEGTSFWNYSDAVVQAATTSPAKLKMDLKVQDAIPGVRREFTEKDVPKLALLFPAGFLLFIALFFWRRSRNRKKGASKQKLKEVPATPKPPAPVAPSPGGSGPPSGPHARP